MRSKHSAIEPGTERDRMCVCLYVFEEVLHFCLLQVPKYRESQILLAFNRVHAVCMDVYKHWC